MVIVVGPGVPVVSPPHSTMPKRRWSAASPRAKPATQRSVQPRGSDSES